MLMLAVKMAFPGPLCSSHHSWAEIHLAQGGANTPCVVPKAHFTFLQDVSPELWAQPAPSRWTQCLSLLLPALLESAKGPASVKGPASPPGFGLQISGTNLSAELGALKLVQQFNYLSLECWVHQRLYLETSPCHGKFVESILRYSDTCNKCNKKEDAFRECVTKNIIGVS